MYINSGLENSDIHKLFSKVTGLEPNLALSILNFAYLHGGCIAGSCALAMYLEKNNMPSYRPYDIDIYIPCKTSDGRRSWSYVPGGEGRKKLNRIAEPPFDPDRAIALDDPFGNNQSHWGFIDRMFQTELGNYYQKVGGIYKTPTVNYYADVDNLAGLPQEEHSNLLWTQISTYKRREIGFPLVGNRWYNERRYNGDKYKDYGGINYDKRANGDIIEGYAPTPMGHQEIQLIFLKEDVDVSQYIDKNYDFSICKVYTCLHALKQENKLVSLYEENIKNRILNVPNNWKYISFAACFKTVTRRFIKYTQRGFIPIHYKAFEAPLLKKQAIYDAMKKSSMKFNAGIVSDSVKMREESLKKLIEKDYNEEGMNGWRNFSQEKSSTPLADSYRKMTIMLKQYLYYKILQIYEKDGPESFRDDTAGGIYILLDEDINNLIDDFQQFDMVKFWESTPGKAILRQISNIPENSDSDSDSEWSNSDSDNNILTFSYEDLILSKSILTSFLEDIHDLLGRALWFLYNKTVRKNKPFPTTGQTWTPFRYLDFPVSKEHQGLLSVLLDVFNDDGSIQSKFNNQAEFLAEISEPSINRMYRNRATHHNDEGVEESKSHDSFEEYGDDVLSRRSAPAHVDTRTYNKDPDDIHIRTLISNIEDLQGLGTHNKETAIRNIRSYLSGGKKKKLLRITRQNN